MPVARLPKSPEPVRLRLSSLEGVLVGFRKRNSAAFTRPMSQNRVAAEAAADTLSQ